MSNPQVVNDRSAASAEIEDRGQSLQSYRAIRSWTERLRIPLTAEDCVLQSMPDASPAKWHLAHTTWFFETFLLSRFLDDYRPFRPEFGYLFNSYYNALGDRLARPHRGLLSRPAMEDVEAYRNCVDERITQLMNDVSDDEFASLQPLLRLGLNHEQQHQELILTDIKHAFASNPTHPIYQNRETPLSHRLTDEMPWVSFPDGGVRWIGHEGDSFSFDNECPRHRRFVDPFELSARLVTNAEYLRFIEDGGYQRTELWLSDGWEASRSGNWDAPLYWVRSAGGWSIMTLSGLRELDPAEPVCHVSHYEADAYARWLGVRLPTETEWETAASQSRLSGNFLESERFHPSPAAPGQAVSQLFGDAWEWTGSAYLPYPGFRPASGALGEYNGKFMSNKMVLRGGSCATPQSHIRLTYRNFFTPETRWQFSGIRLAR
jgi:ergothioneine biosynthesis protein EgtB